MKALGLEGLGRGDPDLLLVLSTSKETAVAAQPGLLEDIGRALQSKAETLHLSWALLRGEKLCDVLSTAADGNSECDFDPALQAQLELGTNHSGKLRTVVPGLEVEVKGPGEVVQAVTGVSSKLGLGSGAGWAPDTTSIITFTVTFEGGQRLAVRVVGLAYSQRSAEEALQVAQLGGRQRGGSTLRMLMSDAWRDSGKTLALCILDPSLQRLASTRLSLGFCASLRGQSSPSEATLGHDGASASVDAEAQANSLAATVLGLAEENRRLNGLLMLKGQSKGHGQSQKNRRSSWSGRGSNPANNHVASDSADDVQALKEQVLKLQGEKAEVRRRAESCRKLLNAEKDKSAQAAGEVASLRQKLSSAEGRLAARARGAQLSERSSHAECSRLRSELLGAEQTIGAQCRKIEELQGELKAKVPALKAARAQALKELRKYQEEADGRTAAAAAATSTSRAQGACCRSVMMELHQTKQALTLCQAEVFQLRKHKMNPKQPGTPWDKSPPLSPLGKLTDMSSVMIGFSPDVLPSSPGVPQCRNFDGFMEQSSPSSQSELDHIRALSISQPYRAECETRIGICTRSVLCFRSVFSND
ncbi:unnamed protein product [Chrysoparadoxa australica]